ncbi:MAG TPA: hypothetical protein VGD43_03000 [Micromonospora sp.]
MSSLVEVHLDCTPGAAMEPAVDRLYESLLNAEQHGAGIVDPDITARLADGVVHVQATVPAEPTDALLVVLNVLKDAIHTGGLYDVLRVRRAGSSAEDRP